MPEKTSDSTSERREAEAREAERAALRALLDDRAAGTFVTVAAGRKATEAMIGAKRRALGL
jgi:hypothetical protein